MTRSANSGPSGAGPGAPGLKGTNLQGRCALSDQRETCKAHLAGLVAAFALTAVAVRPARPRRPNPNGATASGEIEGPLRRKELR